MRQDIVPFWIANKYFYEVPARLSDGDSLLPASEWPTPEGWTRQANGLSLVLTPKALRLPDQGWKIHISTTPQDVNQVIDVVWKYSVSTGIAFKFLRSRAALAAINSKYWSRSASGKFITLYPVDDAQFTSTLLALEPQLHGFVGPYILSDIRYGD